MRIKPSDFIGDTFYSSTGFNNAIKERIAKNIVLISKWNNDKFSPFSWEEYKERCKHKVTDSEKKHLDEMVEGWRIKRSSGREYMEYGGYLIKIDGKYKVTFKFIVALYKYLKLKKGRTILPFLPPRHFLQF